MAIAMKVYWMSLIWNLANACNQKPILLCLKGLIYQPEDFATRMRLPDCSDSKNEWSWYYGCMLLSLRENRLHLRPIFMQWIAAMQLYYTFR